ncbi:MAG TPA: acetyl-CoA carboxylase biotin carboxyl carrier protein subunit [Gemmatimonadales bacterium]|nr:acetyl-CoA carboxylase biotin carboxyl carrier protein subunit [Gemmatimonadales bacterium]
MKYYVRIGGTTHEVAVEGGRVVVGGAELEAHLAAVPGTPLYHLLLAGESWTVAAQPLEGMGRWALGVVGERAEVEVVDERTRQIQALTGRRPAPDRGGTVMAPMPGLVVRVEVSSGQRVEAGARLVVIEAMKMENELRAPRTAVVSAVHVTVGQAVEKGTPLVTLASPEPSG